MQFTTDTGLAIAGLIVGLVAVAMAFPPLLQMLCGGPRLKFVAEEFVGPDGKQLIISIKNEPTGSRFLRTIGVERIVGNVIAYFDIQEQGTNRFIKKDLSGLMHSAATREQGLLAQAHPAFTVGFGIVHTKGPITWMIDARSPDGNLEPIAVGDYTALATIICGEQVHHLARRFKVGNAEHLTFWV